MVLENVTEMCVACCRPLCRKLTRPQRCHRGERPVAQDLAERQQHLHGTRGHARDEEWTDALARWFPEATARRCWSRARCSVARPTIYALSRQAMDGDTLSLSLSLCLSARCDRRLGIRQMAWMGGWCTLAAVSPIEYSTYRRGSVVV